MRRSVTTANDELGLNREMLRELGTAAFLADIGNAQVEGDLLATEGPLTDAQRRAVSEHPLRGVATIRRSAALQPPRHGGRARQRDAPRLLDGGGYPRVLLAPKGLYHHVVAICDRFDALTTARPYRKVPLTPAAALTEVAALSASALHPVIVRAFVHWVGGLPAVRIVLTETGEVGLATET